MSVYVFRREEGFYPLNLANDAEAIANAECNPGTLRVEHAADGRQVWPKALSIAGQQAKPAGEVQP
ncbi:hypothetical protein FHR51_002518 [Xanthomonas arboricola]|uniref:hypothetical protein n=1 Tax=Xanthomonas cannabis TaxID=1885674 RepID=UPI001613B0D6|nr:hypothetical protein [Xanthomonas cannabis]MBB3806366.1 hypothetical protein [Xanthomonas cannabis]